MMSVDDEKAFEDQIERMKQKNQYILEKFQASEEDRKRAENCGATIKKDQNLSIRLKSDEAPKMRNNKLNAPRPKSFHGKVYREDYNQNYVTHNQSNDNRKQEKFRNTKFNDEEVAYQDYMHFQQTYSNKSFNNYNRPIHRQNSNPNYMEVPNVEKFVHQDFNRFNNHNLRNRNPPRIAQNNYQNPRIAKENIKSIRENDFHNQGYPKILKENEFYSPNFPKTTKENEFHSSNFPKTTKENEFHNYKSNPQISREIFHRPPHHFYDNQSSKKRPKPQKSKVNNGQPNVDGAGDSNPNGKKKSSAFDDEYIDDTLEDLEQYRLKVDLEDFIVIDPESPDPILAMPLKPWTDDHVNIIGIDANKMDNESKQNESSTHVLNNANERAKEYLNLIVQNNLNHISNDEIGPQTKLEENLDDKADEIDSLENEFQQTMKVNDDGHEGESTGSGDAQPVVAEGSDNGAVTNDANVTECVANSVPPVVNNGDDEPLSNNIANDVMCKDNIDNDVTRQDIIQTDEASPPHIDTVGVAADKTQETDKEAQ